MGDINRIIDSARQLLAETDDPNWRVAYNRHPETDGTPWGWVDGLRGRRLTFRSDGSRWTREIRLIAAAPGLARAVIELGARCIRLQAEADEMAARHRREAHATATALAGVLDDLAAISERSEDASIDQVAQRIRDIADRLEVRRG